CKDRGRRIGDREQFAHRLVDRYVGGLGRQNHRDQLLERAAVFEFGGRVRIGLAEAGENFVSFGRIHALLIFFGADGSSLAAAPCASFLSRARSSAAWMMAFLRSCSAFCSGVSAFSALAALSFSSALAASRASFSS